MLNLKMNCYQESACSEKSLKSITPRLVAVGILHACWSSIRHNIQDNRRAEMKIKLLTGSYILQANRSCFNQHAADPTCRVSQKEPEGRELVIVRCDLLKHRRGPYRQKFN